MTRMRAEPRETSLGGGPGPRTWPQVNLYDVQVAHAVGAGMACSTGHSHRMGMTTKDEALCILARQRKLSPRRLRPLAVIDAEADSVQLTLSREDTESRVIGGHPHFVTVPRATGNSCTDCTSYFHII